MRWIGFIAFILVLCVLIFPIILLYGVSQSAGKLLDKVVPGMKLGPKIESTWDAAVGRPYDFMLSKFTKAAGVVPNPGAGGSQRAQHLEMGDDAAAQRR